MAIRFFDMFSGIGGFRSGLEAVGGFECIGHCEIDPYPNKAYTAIFDTRGEYYCDDARNINPGEMPDFDLVCAGFPCQSFSVAGKRLGFEDTRGTLFFEVARLLKAKRPAFFLLENVIGLLSHDEGRTLETIFSALVEVGYVLTIRPDIWVHCVHTSQGYLCMLAEIEQKDRVLVSFANDIYRSTTRLSLKEISFRRNISDTVIRRISAVSMYMTADSLGKITSDCMTRW